MTCTKNKCSRLHIGVVTKSTRKLTKSSPSLPPKNKRVEFSSAPRGLTFPWAACCTTPRFPCPLECSACWSCVRLQFEIRLASSAQADRANKLGHFSSCLDSRAVRLTPFYEFVLPIREA